MTALAPISQTIEGLPGLVDRAASMLASAKTAAEVLEAREAAGLAYDMAKRIARLKNAKAAHDELVAAAHRAQADALEIEAAAKRRLADEYDAAQERGEIAGHSGGRNFKVGDSNVEANLAAPTAWRPCDQGFHKISSRYGRAWLPIHPLTLRLSLRRRHAFWPRSDS